MTRGPLHDIAAQVPPELRQADQLLYDYGRWAMHRRKRQRCGSAEGRYSIPPNDDDREPAEALMLTPAALVCQRALVRVPERERIVLTILYVPQSVPAHIQLRRLRIPPKLSKERHLLGLQMFTTQHRIVAQGVAQGVVQPRD